MFVACQNRQCPEYNEAKEAPDGTDLTSLVCGECSQTEFTAVGGPAVPTPPPPPPDFAAPELTVPPSGTPTWIKVTHNGKTYGLPLTPVPTS